MPYRDRDTDDLDEDEYPEPDDPDESEDDDTVPCPYCRRPVYEGAERCPYCDRYLSREDAPSRHPWWIILGVFLCLLVALAWVFGG